MKVAPLGLKYNGPVGVRDSWSLWDRIVSSSMVVL